MNSAELHNRLADVLGVSATQRDLAFEVFTGKIVEILTEGITLKVPYIGYFQLKDGSGKNKNAPHLIFSPLPEDYSQDSKNLYITIEVHPKIKNNIEFDSQVFSIGVGKPLLPLLEEDEKADSETTFAMLRKSIEERVKEVIAESDQIPNFDLWEDSLNNQIEESISHSDLIKSISELTSDLNFTSEAHEIELKSPAEQNLLESLLGKPKFNVADDFSNEDNVKIEDLSSAKSDNEESLRLENSQLGEKEESANPLDIDDILNESLFLQSREYHANDSEQIEDEKIFNSLADEKFNSDSYFQIRDSIVLPTNDLVKDDFNNQILSEDQNNDSNDDSYNYESQGNKIEQQEGLIFREELSQSETDKTQLMNYYQDKGYVSENYGNSEDFNPLRDMEEHDDNDLTRIEDDEDEYEITIQPPTASKQILIDLIQEEKSLLETQSTLNKVIGDDDDLQGIISEELKEYNQEKIAEENSRILKNLLDEISSRKSLFTEKDEDFEASSENYELSESLEDQTQRIEWNWGDELKEEFGIGNEYEDESEKVSLIPTVPESAVEETAIEETESYNFDSDQGITAFDLEKTRQDLFTRLEKTLEHEVTSFREEIEKPIYLNEEIVSRNDFISDSEVDNSLLTKSYTDTTQQIEFIKAEIKEENTYDGGLELKDEKVYLDFKTPPPMYEFFEEKEEPFLRPPKKITILLSPEDHQTPPSMVKETPAIIKQEQNYKPENDFISSSYSLKDEESAPEKKKSRILSIVAIVLSSLVIISAIAGYFLLKWNQSVPPKEETKLSSQTSDSQQIVESNVVRGNEKTQGDDSLTYSEDFTDFPRTATQPEPIKQGNNYVYLKLPVTPDNSIKEERTEANIKPETRPEPKKTVKTEISEGIFKNLVKDTKVKNMIFFDGKYYSYQTSSWKIKNKAEQEVKRLRAIGLNAFAVEVFLPEKGGTWYRIRVGSFNSEQEAAESMRKNNF